MKKSIDTFMRRLDMLKYEVHLTSTAVQPAGRVADHVWCCCAIATVIHPHMEKEVDLGHLLEMIVAYNIVNIYFSGRYKEIDPATNKDGSPRAKAMRQKPITADIISEDLGSRLLDLWREYELGTTDVAQIANVVADFEKQRHPDAFEDSVDLFLRTVVGDKRLESAD